METLFLSCLDYWKHGGILLIPLSVICFFMFFYFFKIFFQIQENLSASFFEHSVDSLLSTAKNEEEIIRVLESKSTFYSKMVIYIIYKISQALITTQMGLMIALPGIFGIAFLKRKIRECEVKIRNLEIHAGLSLKKTDEFLLLKSGFFMK